MNVLLSKEQFENLLAEQDLYRLAADTTGNHGYVDALNVATGDFETIEYSALRGHHLYLEIDAALIQEDADDDDEEKAIVVDAVADWVNSGRAYKEYEEVVKDREQKRIRKLVDDLVSGL